LGRHISDPIADLLSRTGVTPNTLTLMGLLVSFGAAAAVALDHLLIGGLVLLFSGVFDLLDGPLARKKGSSTKFGAFFDSSVDRLSEAALLFGLALLYHWQGSSTPEVCLVYAALVGSLMVSYMRARAEGLGIKGDVGIFTRPERVIVLTAGLVVGEFYEVAVLVALGIIAAFAWVTVLQRFIHVRREAK
jgi:CDP-diacylglycerol--glycerol-3-phosphate 3-phosphatidyltransferase